MPVIPLRPEHALAYRQLMLTAYEQDADAFTSTPEERATHSEAWWVQRIAHAQGLGVAFGAFEEERLVGTVALEFSTRAKTRHKALVIGMYVEPPARGRGLAGALMAAAIEHARAQPGVRMMTLTATDGNEAALRVYRAQGFQAFGVEPMAIWTPGGFRAKVHMWREVSPDDR
jgi:RimJ/RimL family protein N-acetyltransferase